MLLIIKILLLYIFYVGANDISFKEINVYWELHSKYNNHSWIEIGRTYVSSSSNLKEHFPNASSLFSVGLNESIPVLYENSVSDIKNMEKITFESNCLEEIRPRAFKNIQVKSLWLIYNKITKLSRGIFENVELKILDLGHNRLSEIEDGAFDGVKLLELRISSNNLEEVNPEVFNITELEYLDLSSNKIKILQSGVLRNLPKLKFLFLMDNKLEKIEEGTFQKSILEELVLDYNKISSIDSKSFDNMTKLRVINLVSNRLTKWDKNWFYNTPSLRIASFVSNEIKEIPDKAFQNLNNVDLDLLNNKISKFSPKAFNANEENNKVNITRLDLSVNNLTCFEEPLKDVFGSVGYVDLSSNPWDENCENKATVVSDYLWRF